MTIPTSTGYLNKEKENGVGRQGGGFLSSDSQLQLFPFAAVSLIGLRITADCWLIRPTNSKLWTMLNACKMSFDVLDSFFNHLTSDYAHQYLVWHSVEISMCLSHSHLLTIRYQVDGGAR